MLHRLTSEFLEYCRLADFSPRSNQILTACIFEFKFYLKSRKIRSIKTVDYLHLIESVGKSPGVENPGVAS